MGPVRCRGSTGFGRNDLACDLSTDVGVEAVAGQQRVRAGAAPPRVGDARQRTTVPLEQPPSGVDVRLDSLALLAGSPSHQQFVDHCSVDPLLEELLAEDALPSWACAVTRRNPGLGEGSVVEDPELDESLDGALDEFAPIACADKPTANFGRRARPRLEEARRRVEDDLRILNRGLPFALLRWRAPL